MPRIATSSAIELRILGLIDRLIVMDSLVDCSVESGEVEKGTKEFEADRFVSSSEV